MREVVVYLPFEIRVVPIVAESIPTDPADAANYVAADVHILFCGSNAAHGRLRCSCHFTPCGFHVRGRRRRHQRRFLHRDLFHIRLQNNEGPNSDRNGTQ